VLKVVARVWPLQFAFNVPLKTAHSPIFSSELKTNYGGKASDCAVGRLNNLFMYANGELQTRVQFMCVCVFAVL